MAFVKISEILNSRLRRWGLTDFYLEKEIKKQLEEFLKNQKISAEDVRFKKFKNKTLVLTCSHPSISAELKNKETELLEFFGQKLPSLKIEKIFYRLD